MRSSRYSSAKSSVCVCSSALVPHPPLPILVPPGAKLSVRLMASAEFIDGSLHFIQDFRRQLLCVVSKHHGCQRHLQQLILEAAGWVSSSSCSVNGTAWIIQIDPVSSTAFLPGSPKTLSGLGSFNRQWRRRGNRHKRRFDWTQFSGSESGTQSTELGGLGGARSGALRRYWS